MYVTPFCNYLYLYSSTESDSLAKEDKNQLTVVKTSQALIISLGIACAIMILALLACVVMKWRRRLIRNRVRYAKITFR